MQQSAPEIEPRRIGKYEVLGELGHGGMAVVYRARDTQLLRDVAVKVLHPHLANDPESRQRFLREAQAAARLRHPNIVEVYDFSVDGDRDSFMVSELLEGPTLRRFAEQHPGMPAEIAAAIGVVLCDALGCAHGQGVIHRDVKPDNILLQKGGVLKLTDFGIAHVADGNGMTVTGQVLGSPAHMAPEQIEGTRIDARADLFAAGTVLYALAVGRLPFEAPHPHALLRKILEAEYPDPLRVAPAIGHRLAGIIRRCLEREPEKRFANAGELRDALLAFTAESGWEKTGEKLTSYFEDPEGFATSHRAALLERLPELGVKARRAGKVVDALGYFNRALALDPSNAKVLGLVRGISRRRRIRKIATGVGVVAIAATCTAFGVVVVAKKIRAHAGSVHVARPVVVPDHANRPIEPSHVVAHDPPHVAEPTHAQVSDPPPSHTTAPENPQPLAPRNAHPVLAALNAAHHAVAAHPVGPSTTATATPEYRHVILVYTGLQGVSIGVDREHPIGMGPAALNRDLTVGMHTFHIVPNDSSCIPVAWTVEVPRGTVPLVISKNYQCTGVSAPASITADASAH